MKEIIVTYTDGGPDNRTNVITVILADIAQRLVCAFDIPVQFRTPAGLSIRNPANCLMKMLKLTLYGVACSGHKLSEERRRSLIRWLPNPRCGTPRATLSRN
jgi:hypothetical protein